MEALLWVVGVGVVVGLIVWFVVRYVRKANAKYAELWGRLAGLINGTSKGSRMTGTYMGAPVEAKINAVSDNDGGATSYYYELSLVQGGRGQDWSVNYGGEKLLGFGEKRWHVKTKDDALKDRLASARVVEIVAVRPQHSHVSYKAKRGALVYQETIGGAFAVPAPEEFKAQLELLARLAEVNRQVNV